MDLWTYTDNLHKKHFPESRLAPILAGGKLENPKYMFVFINPTYRNVSSDSNWQGQRRPWTGTKYIWRIFHQAGHFDEDLLEEINRKDEWDTYFADKVYEHLHDRGFYFTNLVKWTGENADLPNAAKVKMFVPILKKEIELIDPQTIVTFGRMPFKGLTGQDIILGDYFKKVMDVGVLEEFKLHLPSKTYSLIPCYFPVGRGDPKRAVKMLSLLQ